MKKMIKLLLALVALLVALGPSLRVSAQNQTDSPILKEEMPVPYKDGAIYGYFTEREDLQDQALPLIIYSHGFGGQAERGDRYAEALARAGYRVYSLDFGGGNPNSRTHQDTLAMSVFTEEEELSHLVTQLSQDTRVKDQPIFLLGQSQGGVVSTMVAADLPDQVKGLILVFPAYVLFDDARELFDSVDKIPDVYNHRGNEVGKVYFEKSLDYDVFKTIDKVKQPVLILHGTEDKVAPISYSRKALEHFKNAQLKEIPGAGHAFNAQQIQDFMPDVDAFIKQQLKTE